MPDTGWWMMKDKQQAPCMYDVFGNEIYEGGKYWVGDEGNMADLTDREDRDPNNQIIAVLVETLGTRHILEELGYEKRTFRR